ncbi:MAG: hypothetical protein SGARI_003078, partial [Bacillariaceae sp.]
MNEGTSDQKSLQELQQELVELKQKGEDKKLKHRRDLLALRTSLACSTKSLNDKTRSCQYTIYQQSIRDIFRNEDGSGVPQPYVIKVQAQLCHSLHSTEIQLKQTKVVKKQNSRMAKYLEKELSKLREENRKRRRDTSNQLYEHTAHWQQELGELKTTFKEQEDEITRLRSMLKLRNEKSEDSLDETELLLNTPSNTKKITGSISEFS